MCAAARTPRAVDGRHFALPPPMSDGTGGANRGPITAKFTGVRRFRLGVVNLPHTWRRPLHPFAGGGSALILRDAPRDELVRGSALRRIGKRAAGPPVNRGLTNRVARSRYPKWVGDPDAHEQQVSHERKPALLHVLRRAVPSPRRLR